MIGLLPTTINLKGREVEIDTDYRTALLCFDIYNNPELDQVTKALLVIETIVKEKIDPEDYEEALNQIALFLDGGKHYTENKKPKVMDWEQDEQMIFSAINKVAGREVRETKMHWWTFLGYFNEIGEGLLTHVMSIRIKRSKGKKLTKEEAEFYAENKSVVNIRKKYSEEEQKQVDELNAILNRKGR